MPTLRLTQSTLSEERFRVDAVLESRQPRRRAVVDFEFSMTPQDREDLRWYLEEYLQHAADPAPKIAARVEKRIEEMGVELFAALFQKDDARDLWAVLRDRLNDTRVEIVSEVSEATSIPWELLRDPKTGIPLSLSANAFVRATDRRALEPHIVERSAGPVRILLVICRPSRELDVPFRSVASRLIKAVHGNARDALQLDVLRPPTFSELSAVLREAKTRGEPYHVVHFDGHGEFLEAGSRPASSFLSPAREGAHGYLLFENPDVEGNRQFVDGPALGRLLWETDVPVLVLNACRSAHAEPRPEPERLPTRDVHAEARAFGSLAQAVVDLGVAGVVAMRYNVYVVTAAQFVADLYESLANGETLGEAVTLGRKQLQARPLREIAYEPRPLQDWMVPIVHEAAPIALFARPERKTELNIKVSGDAAAPASQGLAREVEEIPDVGAFFGRDETLLALDRGFDRQKIVLLHAYAGSGKSATAKEFARWYHLTGGIRGPVLFTSFERHKTLEQVLNESIGRVFERDLERAGIHWLALTDEERHDVALQVLRQVPVLWIWDNVEPVHGFPAGTQSAWSDDEQDALLDFLRAARQTKAKFLLTSRRDEREWLGDLPARIEIPAMPMQERVQLARAVAEKHNKRLSAVADWMPLLRFTRGNPMTVTVLVGQALRDGLQTRAQIENFVERLRAGEAVFEDEASEGRDRSLGVSLAYGFEGFTNAERAQLALLHLFEGFVDVKVLRLMGDPESTWCLPEVRGLTRESGIALLDRAADIGLLTNYGEGYYSIHPALPWFFRDLFEEHHPSSVDADSLAVTATRSFVEAIADLGDYYFRAFSDGNRDVIHFMAAEEPNLLQARRLARKYNWHDVVISTMQCLRNLYDQLGRRAEWIRLVEEIVPEFVDLASDRPLPGREHLWSFVTEYRVRLAFWARNWPEAERLQRVCVDRDRQRAAPAMALPPETWDKSHRNMIRTLAVSLESLGFVQQELGEAECVSSYEEAMRLYEQIGDRPAASICAFNAGNPYVLLPSLRDLDRAEQWYRRSLALLDERDSQGQARDVGQLGYVAWERFKEARNAEKPVDELAAHLNAALSYYLQALDLLPESAIDDLNVTHMQLGILYDEAGQSENARFHWREAIRYSEIAGDAYGAGLTQYNVAVSFAREGRLAEAREYALAALRNYLPFGKGASEACQRVQQLLTQIEQALHV